MEITKFETKISIPLPKEQVGTPRVCTMLEKLEVLDLKGNQVISVPYPGNWEATIIKKLVDASPNLTLKEKSTTTTIYSVGRFRVDPQGEGSAITITTWSSNEEDHNAKVEELRNLLREKGIAGSKGKCFVTVKKEC